MGLTWEARKSRKWILWLLGCLVHWASSATVPGKARSTDFLTLRYYGRYGERFGLAQLFPTEVCSMYPATCMDLRLWECLPTPSDMRVPYSHRALLEKSTERAMVPQRESARGTNVLLARSNLDPQGQHLVLWSGCNSSCEDCVAGSGNVLILEELNMCIAAAEGGVFELRYNDGQQADTHQQCWESLAAYDEETQRQSRVHTIIKYTAFGTVAVVVCTIGALVLCYRCHCKPRHEDLRTISGQSTVRPRLPPLRIFDKADIDRLFPTTTTDSEAMCCVCLVNIENDEPCRQLQCKHEFHAECISSWWTHVPRATLECPLCKQRQQVGEDEGEENAEESANRTATLTPEERGNVAIVLDLSNTSPPPSSFPAVPRGDEGPEISTGSDDEDGPGDMESIGQYSEPMPSDRGPPPISRHLRGRSEQPLVAPRNPDEADNNAAPERDIEDVF